VEEIKGGDVNKFVRSSTSAEERKIRFGTAKIGGPSSGWLGINSLFLLDKQLPTDYRCWP
jgi:hypothetical protein